MYRFKQFGDSYIVSIGNHNEIVSAISSFCQDQGIRLGEITGLGAVSEATLRFLNPAVKKYVDKSFTEQMEISSLIGNISEKDGKVYLHIHVNLGRSDCSVVGGHLLSATLNGACELVIRKFDGSIGRHYDEETGLFMYSL